VALWFVVRVPFGHTWWPLVALGGKFTTNNTKLTLVFISLLLKIFFLGFQNVFGFASNFVSLWVPKCIRFCVQLWVALCPKMYSVLHPTLGRFVSQDVFGFAPNFGSLCVPKCFRFCVQLWLALGPKMSSVLRPTLGRFVSQNVFGFASNFGSLWVPRCVRFCV
jgi:hypothetical protein